jgi:acetyltransferase-like isoleucine patch superfamily enzyme
MDWVTTFPFSALWDSQRQVKGHPKSKGDVVIGSDVWIANEALIMSGVEVGHGAIIGARAIVTKNVPAYAVVAGNPARIVKFRFDQLTIGRLLKVKWWEWEAARIENALPALLNEDIEAFLSAAESGRF